MQKTLYRTFVLVLIFSFILSPAVFAQEDQHEIDLGLLRTMGYGGFGGEIQGTFTISASSDDTLERVVFYYDDTILGEDAEAPFKLQFNTDTIEPGPVEFSAVGYFSDGTSSKSDTISRTVVSGESIWGTMSGLILPIIGISVLVIIIGFVLQFARGKKGTPFTPGKYGAAGGAVCPKCGLPFSRNFLSPNLLVGKLERVFCEEIWRL